LFANLVDRPCKANQRLMSPYFGDLAEWLCKAFGRPITNDLAVVFGQPITSHLVVVL
jgi:hypothetical protein